MLRAPTPVKRPLLFKIRRTSDEVEIYKFFYWREFFQDMQKLNELGEKGWEAVSIAMDENGCVFVLLKRRVERLSGY